MKKILIAFFIAILAGNAQATEINRLNRLVVIKADGSEFQEQDYKSLKSAIDNATGVKANDDGSYTFIFRNPDEARKEIWELDRNQYRIDYDKINVK